MSPRMLLATDLDRTLIANGEQPASPGARDLLDRLVARSDVLLAYVSGRDEALIRKAMHAHRLPRPDFVIGDVGTSLYQVDGDHWRPDSDWWSRIGKDWNGRGREQLADLLADLRDLRLQEVAKQNRYKLSYYLPLQADTPALTTAIQERLRAASVRARLVFSVDEPRAIGLLDVLPARASKRHALEALMSRLDIDPERTLFSGDSGNDLAVLVSPIPAVLVANASDEVRAEARRRAERAGTADRLHLAAGGWLGMNGNYAAGILEGVAHFHPELRDWLESDRGEAP